MSLFGNIGNWLWNVGKGVASSFGFDTSSFENDEAMNFQAKQAHMNRDFQERMLQKQMDYQTEMWNKNNQYNSAKSQMDRYRDAGLNPYLMMTGGASAGVASSPGSPSPAGGSSPSGGFAGTHPTPAGQFLKNLASAKTESSTQRNLDADSAIKEVEANYKAEQLLAELEKTRLGNKNQSIINSMQFELLDATHKQILQQTNTLNAQEHLSKMETLYKSTELQLLPSKLRAEISNIIANIALTKSMTYTEKWKAFETQTRGLNGYQQYKLSKETFDYLVEKTIRDTYSNSGWSDMIGRGLNGSIGLLKYKFK